LKASVQQSTMKVQNRTVDSQASSKRLTEWKRRYGFVCDVIKNSSRNVFCLQHWLLNS